MGSGASTEAGTTIVKCFLHISYDEQRERLLGRLDDPDKHWKFNEGDIDERARWDDYQAAYEDAIARCSTDGSPWFVSRPIASGTATGPSRTCSPRPWKQIDPRLPRPELDVAQAQGEARTPH